MYASASSPFRLSVSTPFLFAAFWNTLRTAFEMFAHHFLAFGFSSSILLNSSPCSFAKRCAKISSRSALPS